MAQGSVIYMLRNDDMPSYHISANDNDNIMRYTFDQYNFNTPALMIRFAAWYYKIYISDNDFPGEIYKIKITCYRKLQFGYLT